ncbi:MAG: hypothetical protein EKK40_09600 [Bradyrhizobiaceae bacterium]|nr:MAG: hypothetical protein EKK40_09600 [Bradyrhizobiaceae bacterium]
MEQLLAAFRTRQFNMSTDEETSFQLTDQQVNAILDAAGQTYEIEPWMRKVLRQQFGALRREILKLHRWRPTGAQSTLRRRLKSFPAQLGRVASELGSTKSEIRALLIDAYDDQYPGLKDKQQSFKATLERIAEDLALVFSTINYLEGQVAIFDRYQAGGLEDIPLDEKLPHSLAGLFRRFKERDALEIPIVLAAIVLARHFERIFPGQKFYTPADHSKTGPAILEDARFDSPGLRFGAAALVALSLEDVFGRKEEDQKRYIERLKNALGDAWHNHKTAIAERGSLIPDYL